MLKYKKTELCVTIFAVALTLIIPFYGLALPELKSHAIASILSADEQVEVYSSLLRYAEAKRDWVEAEMAGEQGFLQTESLRIEVRELKRIHDEYAESFITRYTLFTRLGLL